MILGSSTTGYSAVINIYYYTPTNDDEILEFTVGNYNVTSICFISPTPPSHSEFYWSCSIGCSFDKKAGQRINIELELTDSGRLNCTVMIDGMKYTSKSVELRVIGKHVKYYTIVLGDL